MASKSADRMLTEVIMPEVQRTWGDAFKLLGNELKRAIVMERAFLVLAQQDDELVSDRAVRSMLNELWDAITDVY